MKILFVAHRVPYPPDKGDKIRSFHVLNYLATRHEVHVLCWQDGEEDQKAAEALRQKLPLVKTIPFQRLKQKLRMISALLRGQPLTLQYFYSNTLRAAAESMHGSECYDAIYVYSSTMAEALRHIDASVKLIDYCDLDSEKFKQYSETGSPPGSWIYRYEASKLGQYEREAAADFDHVLFINPRERALFAERRQHTDTRIMSNGVDLERYFGQKLPDELPALRDRPPAMLFTGSMDYIPNIDAARWFATAIFPRIRAILPDATFSIAGRNPAKKISQLHAPENGITVTGYVEDLKPLIRQQHIFVAPMRIARGMQTKLLEAMACGLPVVTSTDAARGIGARHGKEVLTGDTEADFARQVLTLLLDDDKRSTMRQSAFVFMQQQFSWDRNLQLLDLLLSRPTPAETTSA